MKKTVLKLICTILCAIMLTGCNSMPFFGSSEFSFGDAINEGVGFLGQFISFNNSEITTLEQTEIVEYTLEFPMCYSKLDSTQQRMYRIMLTAAETMPKGWINLGSSKDNFASDVALAYRALLCDRPEIFWLPSNYVISNRTTARKNEALIAFSYNGDDTSCDYYVTKEVRNKMQQELEAVVQSYADNAKNYTNLFEQELYIHDRLCNEIEYNEDGDEFIYSSYGALVEKQAVCEGYSRAMQLICNEIDIPCLIVYGNADNEGHMWNLINPGDGWYHLDITWDDSQELGHNYFNVNDLDISADHTRLETYEKSGADPSNTEMCYNFFDFECNGEFLNYYNYNNALIEPDYKLASNTVYNAYKEGNSFAELKINNDVLLKKFNDDYNEPISELQKKLYRDYGLKAPYLNAIILNGKYVFLYW